MSPRRGNSRREYYHDYDFYPESQPIQTDRGLKARSKRGEFTENWWARRWIQSLERLMDANRLRRGKRYARQGQVLSIEEQAGGVVATVQGSRARPYRVDVELEAFTDEQWGRVVEALSERPIFTASLLVGEMPADIEEAFTAAGVSLFPERGSELSTRCSCPDVAMVCKHSASVHYILGERFDEDPFLLFRLRGRSEEQLLAELRDLGGRQDEQLEQTADDPATDDQVTGSEQQAPPLEEEIDHFWKAGSGLESLNISIQSPEVELSVLKRLSQPGFVEQDLQRLLAPSYEAISAAALDMALGEDETEKDEEG